MQIPENVESSAQKLTPSTTGSGKKRLQFVRPDTNKPIEDISNPLNANQGDNLNPTLVKSESHHGSSRPSSKASSPRRANVSDIEKTISEITGIPRNERPSSKKVTSRVQQTEIKSGESTATKKSAARVPLQLHEPRKIIDPSNGTHMLGSIKSSVSKFQEPVAAVLPKVKESAVNKEPSSRESVLRTCESVERHVKEDTLELKKKEAKPQPQPKEDTEGVKVGSLILDASAKRAAKEMSAEVIRGTRFVAGQQTLAEKTETVIEQQPESHPVSITPTPPPSAEPPEEKSDKSERSEKSEEETVEVTKPVWKVEGKKELAAIETQVEIPASPKPETPSKNVYSPIVLQGFKEKNKEPHPDMGAGPWLEGSEVESPMKEPLPRRGSAGKMGSRSNSYQGLSRRNSSNSNRATRQ